MVHAFLFGKLRYMWSVFVAMQLFFYSVLVCSADFDVLHSGSFSHHVKFHILFMHKIATGMICGNGKHPGFPEIWY